MEAGMTNRPIIALDYPEKSQAFDFLGNFKDEQLFVKVGMELYYREGSELLKRIREDGHSIFLDLKLHDIPNTVQRAMRVLAGLSVDMVNVHAAGGSRMMKAALEGLEEGTRAGDRRPLLLGVTQLTSTDELQMNQEQLIAASLDESVLHYAQLAYQSGLDGVVCSAKEADAVRKTTGPAFLRVTPGIRPAGTAANDQQRVTTPGQARRWGSSMIVIGRPVTQAADPRAAYRKIVAEWEDEQ